MKNFASTSILCVALLLARIHQSLEHPEKNSPVRFSSVCSKGTCVIEPEVTEGPYYYDTELVRDDITEGKTGVQLNLTVTVLDLATCGPIPNAAVDIWHCDASGVYSYFVNDQNPGPANSTYLRGIVLTNSSGVSSMKTIYPGWYVGRTTHIHIKVHINGTDDNGMYSGGSVTLTSQLFMEDSISDIIYKSPLYSNESTTASRTYNDEDSIYKEMGGLGMLDITMMDPAQGYYGGVWGAITIVVDTTAVSTTSSSSGSSGGPPPSTGSSGGPPSAPPGLSGTSGRGFSIHH